MGLDSSQWKLSPSTTQTLVVAWSFSGLVILFLVYTWLVEDVPIGLLTRDPADFLNGPTYLGAVSSLGFALWAAASAVCLLTAALLRTTGARTHLVNFMLSAGLLSLLLMADDMWLLHDQVFPHKVGIPELVVYFGYAAFTLGHLWVFRKVILRTDYQVLLFAGFFLAFSLVADTLTNNVAGSNSQYMIEDGPKFFGMVTWLAYHGRASYQLLLDQLRSGDEVPESAVSVL